MNNFDFSVLTATDRNYWDAFLLSCEESGEKFAKGTFGYVIGGSIEIGGVREVEANTDLATAFQCEGRLFSPIELHTKSGKSVLITRKISTGLDVISVRPKSAEDSDIVTYSKFVVAAQKIFGMKGATQQPFFPKEHADFFRAQEAAIEKLTRAIAHAGLELEQSRSRLNDEFDEREKAQQVRHLEKEAELEQARIKLNNDFEARDRTRELRQAEKDVEIDRRFEERTKLLDERHLKALDAVAKQREELEAEKKALDDRNATHARRKHQEDIDTLFGNLEKEFGVTKGTQWKGAAVFGFTLAAIAVTGFVSYSYLSTTLEPAIKDDPASWLKLGSTLTKAVIFTAISVSLAVFLVNWLNAWFQKHANEEFRLKRLRLDTKRAIWFVETAREWNEKKGEAMPKEIVDRLTAGLFADDSHSTTDEPRDALANILLGAAKAHVSLPGGGSVDLDRASMKQLEKDKK